MLHANPTLLDTDVEGQKTKTSEKVKELDYTATLIVDFSNLKQSCIILDTKSSIL
jgi:RecA-family ATPase